MRLDIHDLRLFLNVVAAGSLTQGAARAHLSLATVSERIRDMETAVGAPLLLRSRLGTRPTEAGRALLHHAHAVLRQVDQMNDDLLEYGKRLRGYLKVSCNTTALVDLLPQPLAQFLAAYPEVNVTIDELLSPEIVQAVAEGSTDIGVVLGAVDDASVESIRYATGRWVVIAPRHGSFGGRRSVRFAELLDEHFVGLGRGTGVQMLLEGTARALGRRLHQRVQVRNFEAVGRLVAQGLGIGVVPDSVARRLSDGLPLRIVVLTDKWATHELRICVRSRSELPLHARRFLALLEAHAASGAGGPAKAGRARRAVRARRVASATVAAA